jgi:hypothetical protein
LESGQWAVKAQAARAMGTVATKLGGTIAPATQKRLADLLLAALAGRTWTGKECVLRFAHLSTSKLFNNEKIILYTTVILVLSK